MISLLPPLFLNIWHIILVTRPRTSPRPLTISEHASESQATLLAHRILHSLPIIMLTPFIVWFLIPKGHIYAAVLLFSGSFFDSIEVLTLNKHSAELDGPINLHKVTAWIMALSYMGYMLAISRVAEINPYIYGLFFLACVLLMVFAIKGMFKAYFLFMQTIFFVLMSLVILMAHIALLVKSA